MLLLHAQPSVGNHITSAQFQSLVVMFKQTYGEHSDEEHFFRLCLRRDIFLIEHWTGANMGQEDFQQFVAEKFRDTTKVENLDAQIFYLQ